MTEFIKKGISFMLAVVTVLSFCINASAVTYSEKWAVDSAAAIGWIGNGNSSFYVDQNVHYKDNGYSIKIQNKKYNIAYAEKTYEVKPYTTYTFSAMVKYSGYAISPEAETKKSGACIGKAYSYENSGYTTNSGWTKLEYTFITGNETSINLCLQNGIYNGKCKGTAWFSDVKLEKAKMKSDWDVLAIIYTNVKANVKNKSTGKKTVIDESLSSDDLTDIKNAMRQFKTSIAELSDNKMTIDKINYLVVNDALTEKELMDYHYDGDKYKTKVLDGYRIDPSSEKFSGQLDKLLSENKYDHIMVFAPIGDFADWWGLSDVYGSYGFTQINCCDSQLRKFRGKDFPECTIVHEMLHRLEKLTNDIKPDKAPYLHYAESYGYSYNSWAWFKAYMQASLPGGKGIDPIVFKVPSGKYTLVSDDMTVGNGITGAVSDTKTDESKPKTTTSDKKKTDISKLNAAQIDNCTYDGKEKKPSIKIKKGSYTLKKGTDYTVSYSNNKKVGVASAVVTGIGDYCGKITVKFSIIPKPPTVKVTKSGGKLKLSWSEVSGAEKYYIWLSMDGGKYVQVGVAESDTLKASMDYNSKHKYRFAISAYVPKAKAYTDYGYSDKI